MLTSRKLHSLFIGSNIVVVVFIIALSSCAPTKNAAYLNKYDNIENINVSDEAYPIKQDSIYVIQSGDELYISVSTADNEPNSFSSGQVGFTNIDMLSYLVDADGFIKLPYLGKIYVENITIDTATQIIESELTQYLFQPVVSIKLVNARITVLGEVGSPGVYLVNNKPLNIYQALGYAGDITVFGNRENVLIVREENDVVKKKYVDLTNDGILNSDWYVLRPNDIVYVEPLGRRKWGMETFPWDILATAISSTVLIMTFMITLIN